MISLMRFSFPAVASFLAILALCFILYLTYLVDIQSLLPRRP